ncbi:ATP-binding protein [Candidatus Nitrospira bockiana]
MPRSYTPAHLIRRILSSRSSLEGERKAVTVLFCDIANSTALAERLGADAMHALLNQFFDLALGEVHRYEGTINQFLGDGFMALFGAPLAHEDHARRAALAALGIQRALQDGQASNSETITVRMGLHTGQVVVGKIGDNLRMDYTAVGDTTNVAARLQQDAPAGSIYLSEQTYAAAAQYIDAELIGDHRVKGKTETVRIYRLRGATHQRGGGRSFDTGVPLLGRADEIKVLSSAVERVLHGHGGLVAVIGEAGLGKSRLVAEVRRPVGRQALFWLEGRAISFGQSMSYWPFHDVIRSFFGITGDETGDEAWDKLELGIAQVFPRETSEILPYLGKLLGFDSKGERNDRIKYLDAQAIGRQIFRATRLFFEKLASTRPLVLVFEDWHWADESSSALLEHLLPLTETVPLLICWLTRPDPVCPGMRLRDLALRKYAQRYSEVPLAPLSPAESTALIGALIGSTDLPAWLTDLIGSKAEGNPFFIEEVIQSLQTTGVLVRGKHPGTWLLTAEMGEIVIPDTIQDVLTARIDRLDDDVKHVLKVASVIGRSFFDRVLRHIMEAGDELDQHLIELQEVELIREKRQIPELEYVFKHALVQETTYASILADRRRELHRRVAECLEGLFSDRLEEVLTLLAYHYAKAEQWGKAQDYLCKAAHQAGKVAADAEALALYRQALAIYERGFGDRWDPRERAALERTMGEALFRRGEHVQAVEYLYRALLRLGQSYPQSRLGIRIAILKQLSRQLAHRLLPGLLPRGARQDGIRVAEELFRTCIVLAWIDYFTDQERLLLDFLTFFNTSEEAGYALGTAVGAMVCGTVLDLISLRRIASGYHHRAAAIAEKLRNPIATGYAYHGLGMHEACRGRLEPAIRYYRRSAAAYREAGDWHGWGAASVLLSWLLPLNEAQELSEEIIKIGESTADRQVWGWGLQGLGRALWKSGRIDEAIPHLQRAVDLFKAVPDYPFVACAQADLAMCYIRNDALADARTILESASETVTVRRLRGLLLTQVYVGMAELKLALLDEPSGPRDQAAAAEAKDACGLALRKSQLDETGLPAAYRCLGTYYWHSKKTAKARAWWERSVRTAEALGLEYDRARIYLEIGNRTGEETFLHRAEVLVSKAGMIECR